MPSNRLMPSCSKKNTRKDTAGSLLTKWNSASGSQNRNGAIYEAGRSEVVQAQKPRQKATCRYLNKKFHPRIPGRGYRCPDNFNNTGHPERSLPVLPRRDAEGLRNQLRPSSNGVKIEYRGFDHNFIKRKGSRTSERCCFCAKSLRNLRQLQSPPPRCFQSILQKRIQLVLNGVHRGALVAQRA